MSKPITEINLGQFLVKDEAMVQFILKIDGLVYLRSMDGDEEPPITVKQFMIGIDRVNDMLNKWKREVDRGDV